MKGKFFVDTNVLCYLYSTGEPEKADHCLELIAKLNLGNQLVWSTQVIQEFYVTLTKKHHKPLDLVKNEIHRFNNFELVVNNFETIGQAIEIQRFSKISFWDSLIVAAAKQGNCSEILSEDLNSGQLYAGLKVVNPFEM